MSGLPSGWAEARLRDVASSQLGRMLSKGRETGTHARPYLRNRDVQWGYINVQDLPVMDFDSDDARRFNLVPGDVLVCEGGEVGRAAIWSGQLSECYYQKAIHRVRTSDALSASFLRYLLEHYARTKAFERYTSGSTISHLPQEDLRNLPVLIPPLAEQERIVAAIEKQFSRLDAGVAALQRIRQALTQMRAAVLNAAVSGQLISPDAGRPQGDLPDGWRVFTPRELAQDRKHALAIGPFGSNLKVVDYRDEGVPLVFVRQVRSGRFGGSGTRFISETKARELSAHGVTGGDVLITKMGEPPGDAVVYPTGCPDAVITADVIKVSVGDDILPDYLALAINSRRVRDQFVAITSGVAQQKVSLARFASSIHIPLPPLPEQHRIVAAVGETMGELARLNVAVTAGLDHSSALRSAILARAFSGNLVPQNPSDEPASALIERIAAERASSNDTKTGKARERRRKATA